VAIREGIQVILAGAIEQSGNGYRISVRALNASNQGEQKPIAAAGVSASTKADVLKAINTVADQIRTQLGDTAPLQSPTAETFTPGSLEAVREYTIAQDLSLNQKDEDAIVHYQNAIKHDENFGRAYAGWGASALAIGRRDEARQRWDKALSLSDRMTEREKLRTSGGYYLGIVGDYTQALTTYKTLVDKYPADFAGHNNLALAYFYVLDFPKALEEGKRAIDIFPRSLKFRGNYALYAMYAGDFPKAAATASELL